MPSALTLTFPVAAIVETVIALISAMVIFPPLAVMVPKSFVELLSKIVFPTATKLPVPEMVRLPAPVCVIDPPEMSVRFVPSAVFVRLIGVSIVICAVVLLKVM